MKTVDDTLLTPIVRRRLENDHAEVTNWRYLSVEDGFGHAYGVYRFRGEAQAGGEILDWSLILKAIGPATGSPEPTAADYWKREVLVYQSGILNDLPGDLVAARCLALVEYPGEEYWLWLEDAAESGDRIWSLERYRLAARHLGQFNGAYLVDQPIPTFPWLSTGPLRHHLEMAEPGVAELPELNQNPLFKGLLPGDSLERSLKLWGNRQRLLAGLARLPRPLCHHDAHRKNLIARKLASGRQQTVAFDWNVMGTGAIGEEVAALFADSLKFIALDLNEIPALDAHIFAGYMDGLFDAGWRGDTEWVRFGFAATAALSSIAARAVRWPLVARHAAALQAGAERPRLLNPGGAAQAVAKDLYLIGLGEEALALAF